LRVNDFICFVETSEALKLENKTCIYDAMLEKSKLFFDTHLSKIRQ